MSDGMFQDFFRLLFGFNLTLFLLLAFSYLFIESGSASYYAMVLALIVISCSLIGNAIVIYLEWRPFDE